MTNKFVVLLSVYCFVVLFLLDNNELKASAQDECSSELTAQQRHICRQLARLDNDARVIPKKTSENSQQ